MDVFPKASCNPSAADACLPARTARDTLRSRTCADRMRSETVVHQSHIVSRPWHNTFSSPARSQGGGYRRNRIILGAVHHGRLARFAVLSFKNEVPSIYPHEQSLVAKGKHTVLLCPTPPFPGYCCLCLAKIENAPLANIVDVHRLNLEITEVRILHSSQARESRT